MIAPADRFQFAGSIGVSPSIDEVPEPATLSCLAASQQPRASSQGARLDGSDRERHAELEPDAGCAARAEFGGDVVVRDGCAHRTDGPSEHRSFVSNHRRDRLAGPAVDQVSAPGAPASPDRSALLSAARSARLRGHVVSLELDPGRAAGAAGPPGTGDVTDVQGPIRSLGLGS